MRTLLPKTKKTSLDETFASCSIFYRNFIMSQNQRSVLTEINEDVMLCK